MSDVETSTSNDNLPEKSLVEHKMPRSPAVAAYESYATWRKKKFPPKNLDYNAADYTPSSPKNANEKFTTQNPSNFDTKKSSYFPSDDQYIPENQSNVPNSNSALPKSSYFSDSENLSSGKKIYERRSLPSYENHEKYNPKIFHAESKSPVNSNRSSVPENKISREAEHCLKIYSSRSDNSSSPSSFHPRHKGPYSPVSQFSGNSRPGYREIANFNEMKNSPVEYNRPSANVGTLRPVEHKSDHRHSFPACCPNRESDNGEMVKGLLKLIDNQNEQIKNLQSQLDRLLSIHQETLKERTKCICSMEIPRQNQICMQAYNAALHTKSAPITDGYSNSELSRFPDESSNRRNAQFEESKKTLMERKVSIGVMTSFELTVQNSPFNQEAESQPIIEEQEEEVYQESVPVNQDISKRKNFFSRIPSALENITEDSESHLSSSQQPSSNCLSSCKGGNAQNGRRNSPGSGNSPNANNFTNNDFNRSNSPANFSSRNSPQNYQNFQNSPSYQNPQNYQNAKNFQNTIERNETRNPSPSTKPKTQEALKNASPRGFDKFESENAKRQIQKFDTRENVGNKENFQEESLFLTEDQVEVGDRVPPSPAPSIHIDMQDFSSEEGSVVTKRTPKVGWTFYNNVLGQVNNILQNSPLPDSPRSKKPPQLQELDKNILIDTVKAATIEQLTKLGISFVDKEKEANANKQVIFDTSYYSRLNPEINMMQGSSLITETNTSLHMKALAMKYLKEEEIFDAMQQKQKRDALSNLRVSNVHGTTNMSFATMRYLQRYQLLPESMNGILQDEGKENFQIHEITKNSERVPQKPRINLPSRSAIASATKASYPSKILDISTLKQQPKLL